MAFSQPKGCRSVFPHRDKIMELCILIRIRMVDAGQAVGLAVDADEHVMAGFLIIDIEGNSKQRCSFRCIW